MSDSNSIVEFFYNIVPGTLFILFYQKIFNYDIIFFLLSATTNDNATLVILIYIVLGLFLGFLFQATVKFVREYFYINEFTQDQVLKKNVNDFKDADDQLGRNFYIFLTSIKNRNYYLMDNYLRGDHAAFLPTHNSSRFALWSNILVGSVVLLILDTLFTNDLSLRTALWLFPIGMSGWASYKFIYAYYDTIIKSYFMKKLGNSKF